MDALKLQSKAIAFLICLTASCGRAAETYQTINFSVKAASAATAEEVGKAAENYRRQLAIFWLGKPLPNWSAPCKIVVKEGPIGAGGRTTFQFVRGEVLNWSMEVQGTKERILDSVLPHEVNHTIFACHFRRPLPRWADEGAATLFEHRSEQIKQLGLLNQVIRSRTAMITLRELLSMKNYPEDYRRMLTLYAQGYALADFLVQQKGRHAYLKFISDGERIGWEEAIKANFDHDGIESLEKNWKGWILAGMPKLTLPRDQMLAATSKVPAPDDGDLSKPESLASDGTTKNSRLVSKLRRSPVVRSQSPDTGEAESPTQVVTPANSDEAMPSRFLESESSSSKSTMGTRIEAPLPKRSTASNQTSEIGRQIEVPRPSTRQRPQPNEADRVDSSDKSQGEDVDSFEKWISRSNAPTEFKRPSSVDEEKPDRRQLKPTSIVEPTAPQQKNSPADVGSSTKKSAEKSTGTLPSWASFPR